jgi:hypothetical protein
MKFPHDKGLLLKLSAIWASILKIFRQPSLRVKKFKAYQLVGAPSCWPADTFGPAAGSINLGLKTVVCCIN